MFKLVSGSCFRFLSFQDLKLYRCKHILKLKSRDPPTKTDPTFGPAKISNLGPNQDHQIFSNLGPDQDQKIVKNQFSGHKIIQIRYKGRIYLESFRIIHFMRNLNRFAVFLIQISKNFQEFNFVPN